MEALGEGYTQVSDLLYIDGWSMNGMLLATSAIIFTKGIQREMIRTSSGLRSDKSTGMSF